MNKNYYLSLLKKKVEELKEVLKEIKENNYSDEYKKYLLSSYVITLDSILETGIGDLNSVNLDSLTSIIYYTRQKTIHYGFFNGMYNMESIANTIVDLTEKYFEEEQEHFNNLFNEDNFKLKSNNLLIKASSNIMCDKVYCQFSCKDNSTLLLPIDKIFTLTKKCKDKASQYIIDLDSIGSLFYVDEEGKSTYKQITGDELKEFMKNNFIVLEENYNKHNEVIKEIISNFVKSPVKSSQIMEYASDDQYCRNTIDVIKEFIMEKSLFEAYIEHYHLIKDKYSLNKMKKTDYTKLQSSFKRNILEYITQKDAFFIDMTIKRAKYYFDNLKFSDSSFSINSRTLSPILIQIFETGPKYFSKQFISSSPEFKKCYSNLLRYRQIFSHYLLDDNEYEKAIEDFKSEFLSFIKILQMVNLDDVSIPAHGDLDTYYLIERDRKDFFNYKHEQFLEIKDGLYIGKKIYYSSRNSKSDKLIALIPSGNNLHSTCYYSRDHLNNISPSYIIDEQTGRKQPLYIDKDNFSEEKEIKADLNLSNLFKAYNVLRKLKKQGEICIYFLPCEENEHYAHYDNLENVILRFFAQGYLPIELLTKTELDSSKLNKGMLYLKDENGNVIANIINKKKCTIDCTAEKDEKRFFSRIDDITHSFSRRRHTKC